MELPSKYLPFVEYILEQPMFMVMWAAFGVPLLIFMLLLFSKLYKNLSFSNNLNTIIFSSLCFTWIAGFIITIVLLFSNTSGIKLYLIWLTLCLSSIIFVALNNNSINKLYSDFMNENIKKKEISKTDL